MAATVGTVGAFAYAPAAGALSIPATPPVNPTCTPTTLRFPGTTNITCTLRIGPTFRDEHFMVAARSPQFGGDGPLGEGNVLALRSGPRLDGPGTLGGGATVIADPAECSTLTGPFHGAFGSVGSARELTLPAGAATDVVVEFQTTAPPWPGDSLAPVWILSPDVPPGTSSTVSQRIEIPSPEPNRTGVSGVRIDLQTKPASNLFARIPVTEIKAGRPVKIVGSTDPVLNRQKLKIRTSAFRKGAKRATRGPTFTVRTNRKGRFSYKAWRPEIPGSYEVAASYRSQRSFLADDYTCSRGFELVK